MTVQATSDTTPRDPAATLPLWRRIGPVVLKLAAAGILVWWLLASGRIDLAGLARAIMGPGGLAIATLAVMITVLADLVMAARFSYLLRHRDILLPHQEIIGLTLAANLVGVVLPGVVGADAMRATYLAGRTGERRVDAITAVFVDRAVGLVGLLALAALASPLVALAGVEDVPVWLLWIGPAVALASVAAVAVLASPSLGRSRTVLAIVDRLPAWVRGAAATVRSYARAPRALLTAVALAMLSHALLVSTFACAGLLLRDNLSFLTHFALDPLAMVSNAIPLTPGGIGLAEGVFSLLYDRAGSDLGGTVGLLGRMLQYVGLAVAGVPALLLMRSPLQAAAREAAHSGGSAEV